VPTGVVPMSGKRMFHSFGGSSCWYGYDPSFKIRNIRNYEINIYFIRGAGFRLLFSLWKVATLIVGGALWDLEPYSFHVQPQ